MFTQTSWKTTSASKRTPFMKQIRTVPDFSSPQIKMKSTPRIRTSRIQWRVEQKLEQFVPQDADQRVHEMILNSLQYMPKEIINSINLQHYQNSYEFRHNITLQELEYQLVSSLEQIIIEPLFSKDDTNILGVADDLNPYKKQKHQQILKLIEIVNRNIESLIKFLIPSNKKLSQCIVYQRDLLFDFVQELQKRPSELRTLPKEGYCWGDTQKQAKILTKITPLTPIFFVFDDMLLIDLLIIKTQIKKLILKLISNQVTFLVKQVCYQIY